jgi:hypothetical protein
MATEQLIPHVPSAGSDFWASAPHTVEHHDDEESQFLSQHVQPHLNAGAIHQFSPEEIEELDAEIEKATSANTPKDDQLAAVPY